MRKKLKIIIAVLITISLLFFIVLKFQKQSQLNKTQYSKVIADDNLPKIMTTKVIDIDGDRQEEWLEISYPQGSGSFIDFKLYQSIDDAPIVIFAQEGLYQGRVDVIDNKIQTTIGFPREEDSNCCPSRDKIITYGLVNDQIKMLSEEIVENNPDDFRIDSDCLNLSEVDAVEIVQELPEVREYLSYFSDETRTANPSKEPRIIIDSENERTIKIRVYEIDISGQPSFQTTFNTYTIDKCTGKVICSFAIYDDQGKWVRVSEVDECDVSELVN